MAFDVWTLVDPQAMRTMHEHVLASAHTEVGGFLVGEHGGPGTRPRIDAAIESHDAEGDLTHLTFTHKSWEHLHGVIDEQFPESSIIGWYHSHPGHGIFLSGHDQFIQRNFFPAPWQVAIVIDPVARTEGFFVWAQGEIVKHSERALGTSALSPMTAAGRAAFTARSGTVAPRRRRLVVDLDDAAPARQAGAERATSPPLASPPLVLPDRPADHVPGPTPRAPRRQRDERPAAPLAGYALPVAAGLFVGLLISLIA